MIATNPMVRRNHAFCNPYNIDGAVVRGLVGILRDIFGEEEIPLVSLSQLISAWGKCGGHCSVSKIKLSFPVKETKDNTPREYSDLISKINQEVMRRHADEEREKAARHAELHLPTIHYTKDGELRLALCANIH
jgi:hypothetical protein